MKHCVLSLMPLSEDARARIGARYLLIEAPDAQSRARAVAEHGAAVEVVLSIGSVGLTDAEMAQMPKLQLAAALGVGFEKIDREAARKRGIAVINGAGSNAGGVADHAMALLLAVLRDLPGYDRACRRGYWRDELPARRSAAGLRLGLLGFGAIGRQIARRATAFDMQVGYHSRHRRDDVQWPYFDTVTALAQWSEALMVAVPGGPDTHHLVDAAVIAALGPQGMLVNIGRGSVVDTAALAAALSGEALAAAALDVYEGEPSVPLSLLRYDNVLLTPHVAGSSPESIAEGVTLFLANLERHFDGRPLLTPV